MKLAPPLSNGEAPPADELESLLRSYFRAEMPDPWPAPPLVAAAASAPAAPRDGRGPQRSRLALAASVALLIGGSMLLPGRTPARPSPEKSPTMSPGTADRGIQPDAPVPVKNKPAEGRKQANEDVSPRK